MWNHPGDDIYSVFARSERSVDVSEDLLEREVYHYHSKMILKDARVGGAWTWHQDYGYWYNFGLLHPLLMSVTIAVDKATRENGCLQVLTGSHKMRRTEHSLTGEQAGADMERVNVAKEIFPLVYCEMEPGDALFFDCNLLYISDKNQSEHPGGSLICCYNAIRNNPHNEVHPLNYTPLKKVGRDATKNKASMGFEECVESDWVSGTNDRTSDRISNKKTEADK